MKSYEHKPRGACCLRSWWTRKQILSLMQPYIFGNKLPFPYLYNGHFSFGRWCHCSCQRKLLLGSGIATDNTSFWSILYKKSKVLHWSTALHKAHLEVSSSVQNWAQEVGGLARKATITQHAVRLSFFFFLHKEKGAKRKPGFRHKHITHPTSDN